MPTLKMLHAQNKLIDNCVTEVFECDDIGRAHFPSSFVRRSCEVNSKLHLNF